MTEETQVPADVQAENQTPAETPAPAEKERTRQMTFSTLDDGRIRADFGPGLEPVFLDVSQVPEHIQAAAVTEGLIARARSYGSRLEGADRTPAALREVTEKAFSNLLAGVWKVERAPGAASEFSIEQEAAYLFRVKRAEKKGEAFTGTLEEAAANFSALSEDQKKALKALPLYQLARAEVKAKRDAEKLAKLAKQVEAEENGEALF